MRVSSDQSQLLSPPLTLYYLGVWVGRQFLRRSYVVHDHAGKTMYVARGADCGSTVVAIDGTIPDNVTGKCAREEPEADQPPPAAPGSVPS